MRLKGSRLGIGLLLALLMLQISIAVADVAEQFPAVKTFFPTADRFDDRTGQPAAATVYRGTQVLGYVFLTNDVAPIPAYSGKPVNMLVGIGTQGVITGTAVIDHKEPILLVGIPEQALADFVTQYIGKSIRERVKVGSNIDAITGATVTVMVMNETIMRSARKVLENRAEQPASTTSAAQPITTVRMDADQSMDWIGLISSGLVHRLKLTRGDVDQAFIGTEAEGMNVAPASAKGETFIDLYYAYLNIPVIGRNVLGDDQYRWLMQELKEGEHAVVILANGRYSFKGSGYVRGGIFDRIQVQQNNTINFRDLDYHRLSDVFAEEIPKFKEMAIFIIREHLGFDPAQPWQLELLVRRQIGALDSVFSSFAADYQLPKAYLNTPAPAPEITPPAAHAAAQAEQLTAQVTVQDEDYEPIWISVWKERFFQVSVLVASLVFLTLILVFQDLLVRRPKLLESIRTLFLLYTVFFIGWYLLAQLSVVNVLTFTSAIMSDFKWETFLIDPMMFVLWGFVAMTLLLWGRGVYCGWLCPYGAIQELVNKAARYLKVPQLEFPFPVHERLWALKYIILIALFGISLQSLADAERAAEIEPFKTAITLRFQREWGFVLYAAGLILISAFNRKFYCRYLCPLGAALAIPARIRLFDWLKRHNECGHPCQVCAKECEVQAIHPNGQINANECHYCLDCQVTYFNEHKCPPMVAKRKRREKAVGARQSVRRIEQALNTSSGLENIGVKVESKAS